MAEEYTLKELELFPLVVQQRVPQSPYVLHKHDFVELVVILGGRGQHYSERDAYEVMTGDCFVVSGAHGYRDTDDLTLANVIFYPNRLGIPMKQARKIAGYHAFFALEPRYRRQHKFRSILRLPPDKLSAVSALIDRMANELARRHSGYELIATALLMELIGYISRAYAQMDSHTAKPLLHLGAALSHMEQHYKEPMTLDDVARAAHMSRRNVHRAFRSVTGHPPMDYLVRLRIHRACEHLRAGRLNVTETALSVGFNDSNYFTRQFRRIMGCSPRDYARQ